MADTWTKCLFYSSFEKLEPHFFKTKNHFSHQSLRRKYRTIIAFKCNCERIVRVCNLKYSTPIQVSCFPGYETLSDLPYIQNIQASISHTSLWAGLSSELPCPVSLQTLCGEHLGHIVLADGASLELPCSVRKQKFSGEHSGQTSGPPDFEHSGHLSRPSLLRKSWRSGLSRWLS